MRGFRNSRNTRHVEHKEENNQITSPGSSFKLILHHSFCPSSGYAAFVLILHIPWRERDKAVHLPKPTT